MPVPGAVVVAFWQQARFKRFCPGNPTCPRCIDELARRLEVLLWRAR